MLAVGRIDWFHEGSNRTNFLQIHSLPSLVVGLAGFHVRLVVILLQRDDLLLVDCFSWDVEEKRRTPLVLENASAVLFLGFFLILQLLQ